MITLGCLRNPWKSSPDSDHYIRPRTLRELDQSVALPLREAFGVDDSAYTQPARLNIQVMSCALQLFDHLIVIVILKSLSIIPRLNRRSLNPDTHGGPY